jgi:hypothetical protein
MDSSSWKSPPPMTGPEGWRAFEGDRVVGAMVLWGLGAGVGEMGCREGRARVCVWRGAFARCYGCEWRAEPVGMFGLKEGGLRGCGPGLESVCYVKLRRVGKAGEG